MLQRFDRQHLRDFRSPIAVNAQAIVTESEVAPPPPPPPVFSEEDVESARTASKKLGYAEGFEAGLTQAATEAAAREKDIAAATARIAEHLVQLQDTYGQLIIQQSAEMSELVLAIARKVAGEALDARGVDTIVALVARCLPVLFGRPRVGIELHPDMLDNAREVLQPMLAQHGFEGDVQYKANDTLERYDARVEWGQGQAYRSSEAIWREIEALLQQVPLTPQLPNSQPIITQDTGEQHGG